MPARIRPIARLDVHAKFSGELRITAKINIQNLADILDKGKGNLVYVKVALAGQISLLR